MFPYINSFIFPHLAIFDDGMPLSPGESIDVIFSPIIVEGVHNLEMYINRNHKQCMKHSYAR